MNEPSAPINCSMANGLILRCHSTWSWPKNLNNAPTKMVNGILILALSPILGYYLYKKLYHLRFKQLSDIPQLEPSLIWGHLKALNEFIISGEAQRHIGTIDPYCRTK